METNPSPYPLRLTGELSPKLSRGLWLVKWLLAIPHFIVLFFLWIAFVVLSVIAFFAILFAGRYPRGLLISTLASCAGRGALASTPKRARHRPLSAVHAQGRQRLPGPARGHLPRVAVTWARARGVVAVRAAAIPDRRGVHRGAWAAWSGTGSQWIWSSGGLIGLLVLFAGIVLLFTGRYPKSLSDFVLGMNRWVFRVVAYATLMTDSYPPFRLDPGGSEPRRPAHPTPCRQCQRL